MTDGTDPESIAPMPDALPAFHLALELFHMIRQPGDLQCAWLVENDRLVGFFFESLDLAHCASGELRHQVGTARLGCQSGRTRRRLRAERVLVRQSDLPASLDQMESNTRPNRA